MIEQVLEDYDRAYGLKSVCLRYFNPAGAAAAGLGASVSRPGNHCVARSGLVGWDVLP